MFFQAAFSNKHKLSVLLLLIGLVVGILLLQGPIPQLAGYNHFANQTAWLGLPHAENVITNLPFLLFGLWGLWHLPRFVIKSKIERLAWLGFFAGVTLTAFGSTYYHLEPNNYRLIWDRLPITFSFICLFTAVLAERLTERFAAISFLPMVIYSAISVVYWYLTENAGAGDLRPYILVQLLPLLLIPLFMVFYAPRYTKSWMLLMVAAWYLLAKIFEGCDGLFYHWSGHFSGHGMKHLLAALACAQVIWMLQKRTEINV